MRFIGSKLQLLEEIEGFINENIQENKNQIFCDLFSGSASVSRFFKKKYKIISNDIMNFSYVLQKATIEINEVPNFFKLKKILELETIKQIFEYLESSPIEEIQNKFKLDKAELFCSQNYAPTEENKRMYMTFKNAERIDIIRLSIEKLLNEKKISEEEFEYLLACLIEGVTYISNISGVYGAYLKYWDKRALNNFKFIELNVENNNKNNKSYNENAHELIFKIEGDILYLDPPYNNRQYLPNYHVLETISKYDYPVIKGITGQRNYTNEVSKFCKKKEAHEALDQIIKEAKFKYIVMSYSTDGILTIQEIEEIMKKYGKSKTFKMAVPIQYRKYKSKNEHTKKELHELLFFIEKENNWKKEKRKAKNKNKEFLKCPFNYIGGKHKLMEQLMTNFPNKISTFVDLFGGGFNVGINVKSNNTIYNDQITPLVNLFKYFQDNSLEIILENIDEIITQYNLKKDENEGFVLLREHYNSDKVKNPLVFYILICFSFNYQIRFNNSGRYNCPHGTNRSSFSENLKKRLILFVEAIKNKEILFKNKDFLDIDFKSLDENSLVYCDPPYLITTGSYNDGNRGFKNWREKEEIELLTLLDFLNEKKIKFALSNVLIHEGKENKLLAEWLEKRKYKTMEIKSDYRNSNYQKNKKEKGITKEVLIVNY
ncbi:MAG: Dam family site-specific DNA-(adenine-N6)-methyltransferase [Fusobacteriaceae bacterium]